MNNLFLTAVLFVVSLGYSQLNYWHEITTNSKSGITRKNNLPQNTLFNLDVRQVKEVLKGSPMRGKSFNSKTGTIMSFPNEKGEMELFKVFEAPIMHPDLAAKYPDIKSYAGQGIDDPTAIIRFSISPKGLQSMRLSSKSKSVFIEPYSTNGDVYTIYSKDQKTEIPEKLNCLVGKDYKRSKKKSSNKQINANDGLLRTFRLAVACTGEYSEFHLQDQNIDYWESDYVKKGAVLAAMHATMTRVNGIFERDFSISMQLVSNNTDIIFLDSETDQLTDNDSYSLINESQKVCDEYIGYTNYDIGHTFSTGGGGLAELYSPCTSRKARGITGSSYPIGDAYDVDYVAHEMGHQFGAEHTQNNSCNRSWYSSVEPGSASTIMGYAGICRPNIQSNSDDYFHAISIQEIWENITVGYSTCGEKSSTGNTAPIADAGSDFTIPISTPFVLKGNGVDQDHNNALTYCWEQMDYEEAVMPPSSNSSAWPAFRSLPPSISKDRYLPSLSSINQGVNYSKWEVLPSVSRTMNFRLTVRDNISGGASSACDDMKVIVTSSAGPFLVEKPNENIIWYAGSSEEIIWDVAGTTSNGVNAENVDILLSTDGGMSFPIELAIAVPNDGAHYIQVPNLSGTKNRIMVKGSGHIFFDTSNSNFEIVSQLSVDENVFDQFSYHPNPVENTLHLTFNPIGIKEKINIILYDISGRTVYAKSQEATSHFETVLDLHKLTSGMYMMNVKQGKRSQLAKVVIR